MNLAAITPGIRTTRPAAARHKQPTQAGTSAAYTMWRLKRDSPELHARVLRGELSPNGAAIVAGFRTRRVYLPLDVDRALAVLRQHFTPSDLRKLRRGLLA